VTKPSLLLCDDHILLTEALAAALTKRGFTDVAVTGSPAAALALMHDRSFDVCVIDLQFPDGDGVAATRQLRELRPQTQVVILSAFVDPTVVAAGIDAGAAGFCGKDLGVDGIIKAIEQVHSGQVFIDAALLRGTASRMRERHPTRLMARYLTRRELEVLARLTAGESTEGIATSMKVSRSTARTHVQNVLTKLGVHSRLEAVVVAAKSGIRLPDLAAGAETERRRPPKGRPKGK
jgi:two-component system nitrate/nitrite response regulator NarL